MNRARVAVLLHELGLTPADLRALADEIERGAPPPPANDARRATNAEIEAQAQRLLNRAGVRRRA